MALPDSQVQMEYQEHPEVCVAVLTAVWVVPAATAA